MQRRVRAVPISFVAPENIQTTQLLNKYSWTQTKYLSQQNLVNGQYWISKEMFYNSNLIKKQFIPYMKNCHRAFSKIKMFQLCFCDLYTWQILLHLNSQCKTFNFQNCALLSILNLIYSTPSSFFSRQISTKHKYSISHNTQKTCCSRYSKQETAFYVSFLNKICGKNRGL